MNLKSTISRLGLLLVFVFGAVACSNDDNGGAEISNPQIENFEVGQNNDKKGITDSDLPLKADIEAEGYIDYIEVYIHLIDDDDEVNGWEFTKKFTEGYNAEKSGTFNESIPIPDDIAPGDYIIELTVTDQESKTALLTSLLNIEKKGPYLTNLTAGEKDFPDSGLANVFRSLYLDADLTSRAELESILFSAKQKDGAGKLEEVELLDQYDPEAEKLEAAVKIEIGADLGDYEMKLVLQDVNGEVTEVTRDIKVNGLPTVEGFELGSGHSEEERVDHVGKAGDPSGVHQETVVYAVLNRLKGITVTIVQDVEEDPYTMVAYYNETTRYDITTHDNIEEGYFGAVTGSRNDNFHEHIYLPEDMPLGDYQYTFKVEDREGQTFELKKTLHVEEYTPIN